MHDFKSIEAIISSLFSLQRIYKKNVASPKALILRHVHVQVWYIVHVHVPVHVRCTCTGTHTSMFFPDHVNFYVLHMYMYISTWTGTCTSVHVQIRVHQYMYRYMYISTCTDVHVSVYVHVQSMKIYMSRKKKTGYLDVEIKKYRFKM
jgi:hypothetical protein